MEKNKGKNKFYISKLAIAIIAAFVFLGAGVGFATIYIGGSGRTGEINLQKGLVGEWKMDGNAKDATPNANNGTVSGATLTTDRKGQANKAYSFNGTTDYIGFSAITLDLDVGYGISFWVKADSFATTTYIGLVSNSGDSYAKSIYFTANGANMNGETNTNEEYFATANSFGFQAGTWYHIVATGQAGSYKTYVNGNERSEYTAANVDNLTINRFGKMGTRDSFAGSMDDVRIYNRKLSQTEITALYESYGSSITVSDMQKGLVGEWKMDGNAKDATPNGNNGTAYDPATTTDRKGQTSKAYNFNENLESLTINYRVWKDGQTGSATGFSQNGSTAENSRALDTDPWGRKVVVWKAANNDVTSDADGGWSTSNISVDQTKMYRFSTWIRRTVLGNGSYYFGVYGRDSGGSNFGVLNRSNGAVNTNPYFRSNSGGEILSTTSWFLIVAHLWPAGSGTGSVYADTGLYNAAGTKIATPSDFVWQDGTSYANHRTYLYYSTDSSTVQEWVYPRLDVVDGTEPSIQDLLDGFDNYGNDIEVNLSNNPESVSLWYRQTSESNWTHIASSSGTTYVNGQVGTPDYYPFTTDSNKAYIGRTDMSNWFAGDIDDVKIYNRTLSQSEITSLYDSYNPSVQASNLQKGLVARWDMDGNAKDATPYSNNGTVTGAATTTDRKGQSNKAYSFDQASSNYINAGSGSSLNFTNTNNFTVAAWAKYTTIGSPGTNNVVGIALKGSYGSGVYGIDYYFDANQIRAGVRKNASPNITVGYSPPDNFANWHHIIFTYTTEDASGIKLYVDGVLRSSASTVGLTDFASGSFEIGGNDALGGNMTYFNGSIDDVRVYNRALSEEEIEMLYESYR